MAISRKDSFLWGRAPPKLPLAERRQSDRSYNLNDIQLKLEMANDAPDSSNPDRKQRSKSDVRNRKFLRGKKKFNMDPEVGICYLIEHGFLEWRAESVAEFLYKEEGLNKTAIGNFLGERQFLWSFRLPGEAQKIDRMMEAFATRYCDCNPGVFQSTDTCYILSFSIIMLNTSLHNPNVKDKPSLQRFVAMNRGINNDKELPFELLSKLYASIRSEPFKIPEDDGNDLTLTFFNPDREGWLLKMGGRIKTWKRRWFILTDSCLYYFQYTTDKDPIGIIPLENLCVRKLQDSSKPYCLELYNAKGQKIKACKTENKGRVVQGKHQSYKLNAASEEERDDWIDAIRASITKDPFYDLVMMRKRKLISNTSS
uniref:Cytohesin 4a n=1 Tax=Cyprinodon variegatus TaxID=28743 RepID=A0A3Q2DLQ1_CYPVA